MRIIDQLQQNMAQAKQNILIFGATGLIGTYILEEFIRRKEEFGAIGVFTSESTRLNKSELIAKLKERGVEVHVGDLTNESDVLKAYGSFDTIVSALGRGALPHQIDLIRLAEQSPNIQRFIPSEYGTDIEYSPKSATEKPHQNKLKVRKYIKEETKKLRGFYLVTGPYVEGFISKSPAGGKIGTWDVKEKRAVIVGDEDQRIALITMHDVGRYLVSTLLKHADDEGYRAYKVCSFVTTPKGILDEYERQTDSKWTVENISLDEMKRREDELWKEESPFATPATLRRIWAEGGTIYEKWDNDETGMTEELVDLPGAVKAAIEKQLA